MKQRKRVFREFDAIYKKYRPRFRFPVYLGEVFMQVPIEDLELSVRSYNCIRRAGVKTVGDIVSRIDRRTDLLQYRNLGMKSADEIMAALMEYQFSLLSEEGKKRYLHRILEFDCNFKKLIERMQKHIYEKFSYLNRIETVLFYYRDKQNIVRIIFLD